MKKSGELLAIGGAYIDINVPNFPVGEEGLSLETEVVGHKYITELGGSAVNFARLCSSLDIPTTFIGKVGQDEFGKMFSALLTEHNITPALATSPEVATNIGFNMINEQGKSIMAVAGTANQALTSEEVYTRASERLATSSYLFIGGCFKLKKLMPAFMQLAEEAKNAGAQVVLDHNRITSTATDQDKQVVRELALSADLYLPSADEFMQLWGVGSIEDGLQLLRQKTNGTVIVKNSEKGVVILIDDEMVTVPAFPVTPIHTVGAGDSFDAGIVAALHKGKDLLSSIQFGCATAALKISKETLPTYNEVQAFIAQHNNAVVEK